MSFSEKDDQNPKTLSNVFPSPQKEQNSLLASSINSNSSFEDDLFSDIKIFYFVCKQCEKPAKISINNKTMQMDLICENEKNGEHDLKNIPFREIFDNLKIKEKNISKCQKCSLIIENIDSYECKTCSKIYCPKCFIEDINLNSHNNFEFKDKKCPDHNMNYTFKQYCKNCDDNICVYCIKNREKHKNHKFESYTKIMPSESYISSMYESIKEKKNFNQDLILQINLWKLEIDSMADKLISNLEKETKFLQKFFNNFNNNYFNRVYFENFQYIRNYLNEKSNEDIKEFLNSTNFYDKTEYLLNVFENMEKKDEDNENLKSNESKSNKKESLFGIPNNTNISKNGSDKNAFKIDNLGIINLNSNLDNKNTENLFLNAASSTNQLSSKNIKNPFSNATFFANPFSNIFNNKIEGLGNNHFRSNEGIFFGTNLKL